MIGRRGVYSSSNCAYTLSFTANCIGFLCPTQEIILHTLYENGVNNISELESYVRDEIERYGTKLGDIHRRLDATYNEIINVSVV